MKKNKTDFKSLAAGVFLTLGWVAAIFLLFGQNSAYKKLEQARQDRDYMIERKESLEQTLKDTEKSLAFYAQSWAELASKSPRYKNTRIIYENGKVIVTPYYSSFYTK